MAFQSPMMSIPRKVTEDVDWTTPIRSLVAQSYGENPDSYATECVNLQRCRQDAVKGAGSDMTARDLLYKYFGQLELLELRFAEIRVNFPWRDAFTNKLTTQTSIAFEKASVIFQIAATHSSIAASQNRSDPEGLKRSFYYFRTCAGMLTYINDNFLHAPSTDLSREVVKFLVDLIQAQATEVFLEKCIDEKKGNALVAKIAAQVAAIYTTLAEAVKEFMGKGIFDRNWVSLINIKTQHFASLTQYYRALADHATGKYGDSLVRFTLAEKSAKEALRQASSFASVFVTQMSPNLPPDAGSSAQDLCKANHALCAERRAEAQRDNDLIYNAVLPTPETLPAVEKAGAALAPPIPIQEVYGTPEVQKVIGPDLFIRLVPLSVHESASVYSEEKAKLVRGEAEKADAAEQEVRAGLESIGVREGLMRFRAMAEGGVEGEDEVPVDVRRWKEDIAVMEQREGVDALMARMNTLKETGRKELDAVGRDLEVESRDCEAMRVRFEHLWSQAPSASLSKSLRQDLKAHLAALDAAAASDQQVATLWNAVRGDIQLLLSPRVEDVFRASTDGSAGQESLLDLDVGSDTGDSQERAKIAHYVSEIDDRLGKLNKISHERNEVLKDLKEKIQTDDVSHILLLNRRNTGVEPSLFAAELEKFRPYQQRLAQSVHHQQLTLQEVTQLWKGLRDFAGRGPGARKWEERERRKKDTVRRFSHARDGYMEVRDGLAKGLQFYAELAELSVTLRRNVKSFVSTRTVERETLVGQLEAQKRLTAPSASAPPPLAEKPRLPPPPASRGTPGLDAAFSSLSLHSGPSSPPPIPQVPSSQWGAQPTAPPPHAPFASGQSSHYSTPPPMPPAQTSSSLFLPPPPPPRPPQSSAISPSAPAHDPYANLGMFGAFASTPPPPPQQQQQQQYQQQQHQPPPASYPPQHSYGGQQPYGAPQHQQHQQQTSYGSGYPASPPPPPPQQSYQQPPSGGYSLPPPPPVSYHQQQYASTQNAQPYGQPMQSPPPQNIYQGFPPPPPSAPPGQPYGQYPQGYGR